MKSRLPLFALTKLCLIVILLSASLVQSKKKNDFINELQSRYIENNVSQNLRSVRSTDGDETMIFNPNVMKDLVCKSNWFLKLLEKKPSQSLLPLSNKDIDNLIGDIVTILGFDSENFDTDTTNEIMKRLLEYFGFWSANTKYTPDHEIYDEIWKSFTWRDPQKSFLTSKDALNFIAQLHSVLQSSRQSLELKMLMDFFDQPLNFDHNNPRFRSFPTSKVGTIFSSIKLPSRIKSLMPRDMSVVKAVEEAQNMISFDRKKSKYNLRVLNVRILNFRLINQRCQSFITTIPPITQKIVCGEPLRKVKIAGGKVAQQGSWPWMVYLKFRQKDSLNIKYGACGGSLISERHILTAAHCVDGAPVESVLVYPGFVRVDMSSSGYEVENIFAHEDYNEKANFKHDIALIKLKGKIIFDDDRRPICLPPPNLINLDGKIAYIAGWGKTTDEGTGSNVLLEGISFIWSNAECKRVLISKTGNSSISEQQLCIGGDGKTDVCPGDSGGPIMYRTASGQWIVVGIVSHGYGCAWLGFPTVQTRVSTYLDWINAKLIL